MNSEWNFIISRLMPGAHCVNNISSPLYLCCYIWLGGIYSSCPMINPDVFIICLAGDDANLRSFYVVYKKIKLRRLTSVT